MHALGLLPLDDAPDEDDAPDDDAPDDDAPDDEAPDDEAPEEDAPDDDAPEDDAPEEPPLLPFEEPPLDDVLPNPPLKRPPFGFPLLPVLPEDCGSPASPKRPPEDDDVPEQAKRTVDRRPTSPSVKDRCMRGTSVKLRRSGVGSGERTREPARRSPSEQRACPGGGAS